MHTALQATSCTLQKFLDSAMTSVSVWGSSLVVSLKTPWELSDALAPEQGLSVWLYRIERDPERLNAPPERRAYNELRHQPLPLRLHYLMTPIVDHKKSLSSDTEQIILGRVLQVLHDHPTLRGADLQEDFKGKPIELRVRLESLSLDDMSHLFYALERSFQLAVSYEVSVVLIESELQPMDRTPVEELITEYGVIVG
jgi:hypothetical protein